jgi:hypothetical protein
MLKELMDVKGQEYYIFNDTNWVSHLEGELLTIVESLGLPERQEKASKSLLRQRLWDSFHDWGHMVKAKDYEELLKKSEPTSKIGPVFDAPEDLEV